MKKIFLIHIILVLTAFTMSSLFAQQESQYTQFMNNRLYYNPGYAGNNNLISFTGMFRRQWVGFDGAPQSTLVSASVPLMGERIGLGLLASVHELGVSRKWNISMAYSYNLKIDEKSNLRLGIHGTMKRLILDFAKSDVLIRDQDDESVLSGNRSSDYYGNFGFGLYYQYDDLYVGFSIPNAVQNNINLADGITLDKFAQEARHYYIMAGSSFDINPTLKVQPNVLFKYVQNAPVDLDLNLTMVYDKRIHAGLSYRAGGDSGAESIDLLVGYQLEQLMLMLSYDIGMSSLGRESSGSIEFGARYDLIKKDAKPEKPEDL